jgi:translation initiation factor IF-2
MRVHELAKELGLSSKELIERLAKLKVSVKGHMSTMEDAVVARVRQALARPKATPSAKPTAAAKSAVAAIKPAVAPPKPVASPAKPTAAPTKPAPAPAKPAAPPLKPVPKAVTPSARPAAAPTPSQAVSAKPTVAPPTPKPQKVAAKPTAKEPATTAVVTAPPEPAVEAPAPPVVTAPKQLRLQFPLSVKDLAFKLDVKANELIKHLIGKGIFASLTQLLDQATATQIASEFGYALAPQPSLEEQLMQELAPDPSKLVPRAPVVTFMGHVDHGKTSLLDAIRQSKIVEKEAGGITQHIGAYEVVLEKGRVTFLDTPGHEAFTALRARGANATDVVVLVVAADDGVMPQTLEAIDHAKAAGVPIVVAINKMDKPDANPQKVKQQLAERGLMAEDWGGKVIMVPVSAKTRQGIDGLLEMLLLEAELLELKADPTKSAQGVVIEARLSKDRGPIATLLIQQGTLRVGDLVVVGTLAGRVRALTSDRGHRVKEAHPASPVEILGLPGVPQAGDRFMVLTDDKRVRQLMDTRQERLAARTVTPPKRVTLDDLYQRITEGTLKELKLILKVDVQGSLEAITTSLSKLETKEVKLSIIHMGVGDISESDVMLAAASDAVVIGFHVGVDPQVQVAAVNEGVDVRIFQIIYELVNAIKAALEGLLEPKIEEVFLGRAEVRRLFQISKVGIVAGCYVNKGTIRRDAIIRVIRGKDRVAEAKVASLKRVKDDVREVAEGFECGIALEGSIDLQPGDLLEAWEQRKVARKLA